MLTYLERAVCAAVAAVICDGKKVHFFGRQKRGVFQLCPDLSQQAWNCRTLVDVEVGPLSDYIRHADQLLLHLCSTCDFITFTN